MGPADVKAFTRAEPFRPFRVRLTDGTAYEVHYPHMAMSVELHLVIGLPDPETNGLTARDVVEVPWDRVLGLERLVTEGAAA
jgi:hypothetical protein